MISLPGPHEINRFRELILSLLGLQFDESKFDTLARVLHNRALATTGDRNEYLGWLAAGPSAEEIGSLARELTITETYFLRNMDQFNALIEVALPHCMATIDRRRNIQLLSAGCASGDEPYSLAIAVREYLPELANHVSINALDINPAMLQKAEQARYSNWSLRECPAHLKARWFNVEGDAFVLKETIRRAVNFEARNLSHPAPEFWRPGRFDIVFCRNILMYFSIEQAQAAIARIAQAMVPGGYFFLGHAETLRGLSNDFHLCHTHGTFYYQRKEHIAPSGGAALYSNALPASLPSSPSVRWQPAPISGDTSWIDAIQRASERIHALVPAPAGENPAKVTLAITPAVPDLHRALDHLHNERFDDALAHIGDLPMEHAADPDVLLLKAVSLSHSGALVAAEAVCHELLVRDELSAGAHYVLALCREGTGDIDGAREHNQSASYLDPEFAMPRLHIGLLARRQGDLLTARQELATALLLLQKEEASRILLFGGGFKREALIALCRAELAALGGTA